jgi:hypothetical protein
VFTDDCNPVEIMVTGTAEKLREDWRKYFGKDYML